MIDIWQLRKVYDTPTGPAVIVDDFTLKARKVNSSVLLVTPGVANRQSCRL